MLKKLFGVDEMKSYDEFKLFNQKILKVAQKEAKEKFGFEFEYTLKRENRKVYEIVFSMTNEAKKAYQTKLDQFTYSKEFKDNKIVLNKEDDEMLNFTKKRHMLDTIEAVKYELKDIPGYTNHFKDVVVGDKFGHFYFIEKDSRKQDTFVTYSLMKEFIKVLKQSAYAYPTIEQAVELQEKTQQNNELQFVVAENEKLDNIIRDRKLANDLIERVY